MYVRPFIYPLHPYYRYNMMRHHGYRTWPNATEDTERWFSLPTTKKSMKLKDYGKQPFVVNINEATKQNKTYRTAIWTGTHLQVTLMSIAVGEDIGLEMHPHVDQFLRIEQGQGVLQMGKSKDHLSFERKVNDDFAMMIPAGTWHNVTNTGSDPLKLYSIYAPPNHPFGTVHRTKVEAERLF